MSRRSLFGRLCRGHARRFNRREAPTPVPTHIPRRPTRRRLAQRRLTTKNRSSTQVPTIGPSGAARVRRRHPLHVSWEGRLVSRSCAIRHRRAEGARGTGPDAWTNDVTRTLIARRDVRCPETWSLVHRPVSFLDFRLWRPINLQHLHQPRRGLFSRIFFPSSYGTGTCYLTWMRIQYSPTRNPRT